MPHYWSDVGPQPEARHLRRADFEHIGAAPSVVKDFKPRDIYLSALERGARSSSLRNLRASGVVPAGLSTGMRLDFGGAGLPASAEVLFPPAGLRASRADDRAIVLRLDVGSFRVLWCNDAGFTAEKFIVEKLPVGAAACDALIRNQNAADTTLLPEFLDRARPRLIVSSNNTFPDPQKLPQRIRDLCAARRITLLDQGQTGAVTLRFWPGRMEAVPFRAGEPALTLLPRHEPAR